MSKWYSLSFAEKLALRESWQKQAEGIEKHRCDLRVKGTAKFNPDGYEEARLVIYDKSTPFEITGVNDTGQWTVRRIFE